MKNNLGMILAKRSMLSPEAEAYVEGADTSKRYTFGELNDRCNQIANAYLSAGIQKGDRVAFLLMNSIEFMESYFALAKIGAVVVPLNWRLVPDELEFILKDSGATRLIFDEDFVETVVELHGRGDKTDIRHWLQVENQAEVCFFAESYQEFQSKASTEEPSIEAEDSDMLYIMYTSGTTGLPKGVVHTHDSSNWALITFLSTGDLQMVDRYLACLPMFHVGALMPLALNVYRGTCSIVMRSFDPTKAWELIEQEKITTGLCVPAMMNFMVQVPNFERFDYSTLRWIMTGAAPVPVSLTQQYLQLGIGVLQVYGLTETCGPACLMDGEFTVDRPSSAGKAFFHTDVKVAKDNGEECAPNEAGEVWVRGKHVMMEYWNRPEATAETLVDGWLRTGDVAVMDEERFIFIQDRIKDMIISGGENIYPAEIEGVLASHPGVKEAAVIGLASEKWGESPLAIIVKSDEALTVKEVLDFCEGKLARFKQPQGVEFVEEIPRNPSGKILKRLLREDFTGPAPV